MIPAARLALGLLLPGPLAAQGLSFQAGHLFDTDAMSSYQLSWSAPLLGVLSTDLGGIMWRGPTSAERRLGLSLDATLFRGGRAGPYAVGGVAAGFGFGGAESTWRSWSAGLGYELVASPLLSLGVEGRWQTLQPLDRSGAQISVRLGTSFGRSTPAARPVRTAVAEDEPGVPEPVRDTPVAPVTLATASTIETAGMSGAGRRADEVVDDVIRFAEAEVGTPYHYGGTGEGDEGFDCSGLIQYAYGQAGITLPRTSVEQAKAGARIAKSEGALRPGDILTFARTGRRVTHVGLYIGDGRFIHSASKGVQISRLSADDPYGRWWYQRWVGVRRVVPVGS